MSFIREYAKKKTASSVSEVSNNESETEVEIPEQIQEILPIPNDHLNKTSEQLPTQEEVSLGQVEYQSVKSALSKKSVIKSKYVQYSDQDRYKIARYASDHGSRSAARNFQTRYPNLNESTVRGFLKKYKQKRAAERAGMEKPTQTIAPNKRGRPILLGHIDEKVQTFLRALRKRGGVVNTTIAMATATAC